MMHPVLRPLVSSRLLFLTSLPALDGTLFVLAAAGRLASLPSALVAGLTVIAGTNAWLAARDEFRELHGPPERWRLAGVALASTALALASAWAGGLVGRHVHLQYLPIAAGAALLLLGVQTVGWRLRVSPLALLAVGVVAEVAAWIR